MFVFLTLLNEVFKTYFDSLKRDLGEEGFKMVLIIALNAWAGLFIIAWLLFTGNFQMPNDYLFYLLWIGLAILTEISFALLLLGMLNTTFFASNSLGNLSFAITAVYAAIFLGERYNWFQVVAIVFGVIGSFLFFKKTPSALYVKNNKGVLLIFFSLLLTPLEYILYKAASEHVNSYHQFLTGRLAMDFLCYTLFFLTVTIFWYRKNPFPQVRTYLSSGKGIFYIAGHTATELLESWLIYKIPISLFTILGTLSIPVSYFIGKSKYKEVWDRRYVLGALLITVGVILFVMKAQHLPDL